MSNDTVVSLVAPALVSDPLTELLRSGARRLIEAAVRTEFEEYLSSFGHEKLPEIQALHCPHETGQLQFPVRSEELRCRLTQIVFMYAGSPENYGTAVDGDGSPSTAPTGNSAIQIWSPSGVNCPVRMRAMG